MRSITVDELLGFLEGMLELWQRVDLSAYDAMDLCGTGGDGKNTFNISTIMSFVLAGAGVKVAKHGNYGVSSPCGSSNVLEYLGIIFTTDEAVLQRQIEEANICFLHAPLFYPAAKAVAPVRLRLGVKTFFNMLGPMVNPAFVKRLGVNNRNLKTFTVDIEESMRLFDEIQEIKSQTENDFVFISESGLSDVKTVLKLREKGFQGFLMGEYFMKHQDPAKACREFIEKL